ncbi:MAG: glycosyltransferase involved in cell wall biosynthesis [Flavobacteriales bacterium]|jgi:glycosyltransferase involved in cell wall biosynthesis
MKISVIIPCYNVEQFIEECIDSLRAQSFQDFEVICVNDGSSDRTGELLDKLSNESELDIKVISQENKGASSARNHGLKHATGGYIQFLDADDLLTSGKLEHQLELIEGQDNPSVIFGSYRRETLQGKVVRERKYDDGKSLDVWHSLMRTDLGITSANLFKADLFKNGIQWSEHLRSSQEYDLMFQIMKQHNNLVFDPEVKTIIRVRESGSISQTNIDQKWERYVQLRVDIMDYLKEKKPKMVKNGLYQVLFDAIRMFYPHQPGRAKQFYKEAIPSNFTPSLSAVTGHTYIRLFRLMGFAGAEKARAMIKSKKAE